MRAILIDDESLALESLEYDIKEHCPEVDVIGMYTSTIKAIAEIERLKPDLVMTDIQMPRMNAFTMLDQVKWKNFDLILVTAFNKYAVLAFEFSACDYIVKPVDPQKLIAAVNKVKEKRNNDGIEDKLALIMHNLKFGSDDNYTLAIPTLDGAEFIEVQNITHIKADSNYCAIHFNDGTKLVVSKPMKHFADILGDHKLLKIHQSHVVNTAYIKRYRKGVAGSIILLDGTVLAISRSQKSVVNEFLLGK